MQSRFRGVLLKKWFGSSVWLEEPVISPQARRVRVQTEMQEIVHKENWFGSSVWLEYLPVTQGVAGSSPVRTARREAFTLPFFVMRYYVYIIYSQSHDIYYKGYSTRPFDRLNEHNNDESRYTSGKGPWELVFVQEFPTKREALQKEKSLKRANRKYIEWLIKQPFNLVSPFRK